MLGVGFMVQTDRRCFLSRRPADDPSLRNVPYGRCESGNEACGLSSLCESINNYMCMFTWSLIHTPGVVVVCLDSSTICVCTCRHPAEKDCGWIFCLSLEYVYDNIALTLNITLDMNQTKASITKFVYLKTILESTVGCQFGPMR